MKFEPSDCIRIQPQGLFGFNQVRFTDGRVSSDKEGLEYTAHLIVEVRSWWWLLGPKFFHQCYFLFDKYQSDRDSFAAIFRRVILTKDHDQIHAQETRETWTQPSWLARERAPFTCCCRLVELKCGDSWCDPSSNNVSWSRGGGSVKCLMIVMG